MTVCLEKKHTLFSKEYTFKCELLYLDKGVGVLKYVIDRNYDVAGVRLAPGDVTIALFWSNRPYTLYIWDIKGRRKPVYYFNVADRISLSPGEFIWRDLVLDILIDQDQQVHVLDEEELPADLSDELKDYMNRAKSLIIGSYRDIIDEADRILSRVRDNGHNGAPL